MANWIEYTESKWHGLNLTNLNVDQTYLVVRSHYINDLWLYTLSDECYKCPYEREKNNSLSFSKHKIFKLNTAHPLSVRIFDNDIGRYAFDNNETSLFCNFTSLNLGEFGVYNLTVTKNGSCNFIVDKQPVDVFKPILLVCFILLLFTCIIKMTSFIYKKYQILNVNINQNKTETENVDQSISTNVISDQNQTSPLTLTDSPKKKRLHSLDTFRGLSIVLMIFVNSGGGHYWWIEHAKWNGLHLADIVFPSFLWIMGVCIPISIKSQLNRGHTKKKILKNILWRSIKLFLIGICLNSINGPNLEELRIMGVLQRFGIAYFVTASLHTIFRRTEDNIIMQTNFQKRFHDIKLMRFELLWVVILTIIYLIVIFAVNAPDCPRGYLGPGGKHDMAQHPNCIGGIIGYIDKMILTNNHIYQKPTAKYIYNSSAFDPEGLFGCILTIVQVFLGIQCGITLTIYSDWKDKIKRWVIWSSTLGIFGGCLCEFSIENGWIPINKNLWSLSFVCITSSIAFGILSIFYYIIDVKSIWNGKPFTECGKNSILMYIGHTILHKMLPWHWRIGLMNTHFILLLECTWNTILWIGIALYLCNKEIFYNL